MFDEKTRSLAETFGNFWLQTLGAAAQGLSEVAKQRRDRRAKGKFPDRDELYYLVARGLHEALKEGEKAAGKTCAELAPRAKR
jgi:hypothetical protein